MYYSLTCFGSGKAASNLANWGYMGDHYSRISQAVRGK